jgi:hypothetical protein
MIVFLVNWCTFLVNKDTLYKICIAWTTLKQRNLSKSTQLFCSCDVSFKIPIYGKQKQF